MIVMMMPSKIPKKTVAEYRRIRLIYPSFRHSFNQYINARDKTCSLVRKMHLPSVLRRMRKSIIRLVSFSIELR